MAGRCTTMTSLDCDIIESIVEAAWFMSFSRMAPGAFPTTLGLSRMLKSTLRGKPSCSSSCQEEQVRLRLYQRLQIVQTVIHQNRLTTRRLILRGETTPASAKAAWVAYFSLSRRKWTRERESSGKSKTKLRIWWPVIDELSSERIVNLLWRLPERFVCSWLLRMNH